MRAFGRRVAALAAVAVSFGAVTSAGGATTRFPVTRFPVIGCDSPKYSYANHYGWEYAPSRFCRTRRGSGVVGIDHTRWHGWGAKRATGRGDVVVHQGGATAEFPATITAYGFWSTQHFLGGNEYASAYRYLRVRVLSRRAMSGTGVWRGPANVTLDVHIQE